MKQCPVCRTTYTDVSLAYCLADGSPLESVGGEQETVARQAVRIDVPEETVRMNAAPQTIASASAAPPRSGNLWLKVLLAILGLGFLAAVAVAVGVFIYFNNQRAEIISTTNQATPRPTPSATPDEADELRDVIANLEKLLTDQKKGDQSANVPLAVPKNITTTKTARVDSPGDGFLALRTLPNSEIGERILKIPHGATVSIGLCGPVMRPVKRSGRWCQASYNGQTGWVFDGFLVYQ